MLLEVLLCLSTCYIVIEHNEIDLEGNAPSSDIVFNDVFDFRKILNNNTQTLVCNKTLFCKVQSRITLMHLTLSPELHNASYNQ